MRVHRDIPGVEFWYNPNTRAWYAATVDAGGNLGESVNAYTRQEVLWLVGHGFLPGRAASTDIAAIYAEKATTERRLASHCPTASERERYQRKARRYEELAREACDRVSNIQHTA